jgi:hypothetical protein
MLVAALARFSIGSRRTVPIAARRRRRSKPLANAPPSRAREKTTRWLTRPGTEFVRKDNQTGTVTGQLTLHGVTKPVTLNVVVNKVGQNPLDKIDSAGFSARGTFKRSDFGMKTYLGAIGDDVDLFIEIEAKKKS